MNNSQLLSNGGGLRPVLSCGCGRVDVHSHFLPPPYRRALADANLLELDGGIPVPDWSPAGHLEIMDEAGVAHAILSISSPGLHFLEQQVAIRVARATNEAGAELVTAHRGRFGAFGVLPLPDVSACLAEIAHVFDVLKLDGIGLETNARGLYLGDPHFAPIFDELDRRGAVVFVHPTSPECLKQIGMGFPAPLIEFPFETARSIVSLIFAGVLKERPNIRAIFAHGGGALPILLSRIAGVSQTSFVSPRPSGGAVEVMAEVRRLYFDLAAAATPVTLDALLKITDASKLLFGTDYPFAPRPAIAANTESFGRLMDELSPADRERIEFRNAASLFPRVAALLSGGA